MAEELTPEQEERVRRMLADARHSEPMPAEVSDRMDRVLAGLAAEPDQDDGVVTLADRRRRVGRLLLAAAAVVVVGVGIGQFVGGNDESADESSSALDGEDPTELTAPDRDGPREGGAAAESAPAPGDVAETRRYLADVAEQRVREEGFVSDARRARRVAGAAGVAAQDNQAERDGDQLELQVPRSAGCQPGVWGIGRYVPASYAQSSGWLVFRRPLGDTQVVDLFLCGEDDPERSATLPSS